MASLLPSLAAFALVTVFSLTPMAALSLRLPRSNPAPLVLSYHKGPVLTGDKPIALRVTFYGDFSASDRDTLISFLSSLTPAAMASHEPSLPLQHPLHRSVRISVTSTLGRQHKIEEADTKPSSSTPTVPQWWSLTKAYTDSSGNGVSQHVLLDDFHYDHYSKGKFLSASDIASLVQTHANSYHGASHDDDDDLKLPIYILFTASDVFVEGFCMHTCGQHSHMTLLGDPKRRRVVVPFAWVGNPASQCPGFCSWPFAKAPMGPPTDPLNAPNGIGVDGMAITLAKVLVGVATNPFRNGYYQGHSSLAVEGGSACIGIFGEGAYPGYPGRLLKDSLTGATYNMEGANGKKFLVPWIWNPVTLSCVGQP